MNFIVKNNIFIMIIICIILTISINVTYSKFTYSKILSGQITTCKTSTNIDILIDNEVNGVTLDTSVNFANVASSTNGQGLMMRNGTQNDENPIIYYRGDVTNNNLIFADFCWLIVRSTDKGGLKLMFNGPVVNNEDGTQSCTNYSGVGGEEGNANYQDVLTVDGVLYPHGKNAPYCIGYMCNVNLGTDFDINILKQHFLDNEVDLETGRHVQNLTDTGAKGQMDNWYKTNISGKTEENLVEDAVWCSDRSITSSTYNIDNFASNSVLYYSANTRLKESSTITPTLECSREIDRFTVNKSNGNGDLTYPIGTLTADEYVLAGHNFSTSVTSYLNTSNSHEIYTLSPNSHNKNGGININFVNGILDNLKATTMPTTYYIRHSIVINNQAKIVYGDGSFKTPYLIES